MSNGQDICLKIAALNPDGSFIGGTVDLEFRNLTLNQTAVQKGVDASQEIPVSGLLRAPQGNYQVTVTPSRGFKAQPAQFVNIPASGSTTLKFTFQSQSPATPPQPSGQAASTPRQPPPKSSSTPPPPQPPAQPSTTPKPQQPSGQPPATPTDSTQRGGEDICLVIRVLDPQKNLLGGTVDIEYQPQDGEGETQKTQGADASKLIQVSGLQRFPQVHVYQVTVTPTDVFKPTSQFLTIPASGFNTVDFVIDKGTTQPAGPPQLGRYVVKGTVRGRNSEPLSDAHVIVWWQHIREREQLAAGETSEDGTYCLRYDVPENPPDPILLVVEAQSEHLDTPLFSPLTQAQPTLEIDLNFEPPDQSEWATMVRSIEPLLDGLKLSDLVENSTYQDISFLARELSKSTETIMRVAVSARLEVAFKIPAPAFYAFLRQRVPAALPSPLLDASQNFTLIDALVHSIGSLIFSLSAQVQTQTLTAAVALDLIGPQFTTQIPQLVNELQALHTTDLLNQPYLVGNATLAQLLDVAALPQAKQQTFAQALATNNQSMRNFWRTLGDGKHGFTAAEASSIERTLSIGAFVKNFTPLVTDPVPRICLGSLQDAARPGPTELAGLGSVGQPNRSAAGHRCRGDGHPGPGIRECGLHPRDACLPDRRPFRPDRNRHLRSASRSSNRWLSSSRTTPASNW